MKFFRLLLTGCIFLLSSISSAQQPEFRGFFRAGAYPGINEMKNRPEVATAFSDIALITEYENGSNFRAYSELQFRYGAEFGASVSNLKMREAYTTMYGKKWDISAGKKIIRWGRADFTNPTSRLTPRDFLLRSPDREEMNMGNILAEINFRPVQRLRIQAVVVPLYRSSVLIIDPVPLPSYAKINLPVGLLQGFFSYGLRSDFYLNGIDLGVSWFDGYDPMPGIALTQFNIQNTGGFPMPVIELNAKPYHNRMAGADFETNVGSFGFRGEAALLVPSSGYRSSEYVPLPSLDIVAGSDWSGGNWRISAEYYGKYMYDYFPPEGESLIGAEADIESIALLMSVPGFDLREYVRKQVAAFNRLYNYQLKQLYHSAGIRVESDLAYGRFSPSVFTLCNITSGELLFIPEIKYKPADGLRITIGAEYYKGKKGSLYKIIDSFMNSLYVVIRTDF